MGNIYPCLKWRGDLNFTERPFCEVDNLVFSQLAYMDFTGIVPTVQNGGDITLAEAAEKFWQQNKTSVTYDPLSNKPTVLQMMDTTRYRSVRLSKYADIMDLGIFALFLLGKRLLFNAFSNETDTVRSKYKVIFYMIAMCGLSFLLAKTSLVQRFTDLIIGAFFMLSAYRQIRNTFTLKMKPYQKILTTLSAVLLFLLGLVPIISINFEFVKYAVIAGICILVYGTWKIVYSMYQNGNRIGQ